jgi:DNA-binding transcriptional LysR family regulator
MARLDSNRSGEMEVFVRAVELGGFSAAARAYRMTPSAVSKLVSRLETRLGVRLINRSTRRFQLTPEGCAFYERSVRIIADIDEAERTAVATEVPSGRLRVNANVPFGTHFLLPLAPGFLARYPSVSVDIVLTDEVVDLLAARADVAIRAGPLKSSRLVARKLGETRMVIVGASGYIERHGRPRIPRDLERHNRIGFGYVRVEEGWPFIEDGRRIIIPPLGNAQASNGEAVRGLALAGLGLARLAAFQVRDDIAAGRLLPLLEEYNPGDVETVHAVFLGRKGELPARVRVFLDYLVQNVRMRDLVS